MLYWGCGDRSDTLPDPVRGEKDNTCSDSVTKTIVEVWEPEGS